MKDRILRFLKKNVWDDKNEVVKIVLRHVAQGNKIGNEIGEYEVSKEMTVEDIEALSNDVLLAATDDQEGIGGTQRYVLLPYRKGSDKSYGRLVFAVSAEMGEDGDNLDSEPPNGKGIVTQLMRHNEAIMRQHTLGISAIITAQQRTINRQSEQLEIMGAKHFEAVSLIEDLTSRKHERELEEKRLELKQDMQREAFGSAKMLMPFVVNKLAGKEVMKVKVTPQQMMLKKFADTLTPDQINGIVENGSIKFTPQQKMVLLEMMSSLHDVGEDGEEKSNNGVNNDHS